MTSGLSPVAKAEMLIRRPVAEVFEAFIDPEITTKFWFSRSSGRLEPGRNVTWEWEMYGVSAPVDVRAVERDARIVVEWGGEGASTTIEWTFTAVGDDATFVSIANSGFEGDDAQAVAEAIGSTEGFAFVLAGLKALLEHGVALNLVPDRMPAGLGDAGGADASEAAADGGRQPQHAVVVTRSLDLSPERVYAAWTEPALMRRWMGDRVDADVRVGGRYRIESGGNGGTGFVHVGEYRALEPGRRVLQTFLAGPGAAEPIEDPSHAGEFVEIALEPGNDGGTQLTLTNGWNGDPLDSEGTEAVRAAWSEWLDLLAERVGDGPDDDAS